MKKVNYRRVFFVLLIAVTVAILFRTLLFASYVIDGKSMEPTLDDGNLLMVNKVSEFHNSYPLCPKGFKT